MAKNILSFLENETTNKIQIKYKKRKEKRHSRLILLNSSLCEDLNTSKFLKMFMAPTIHFHSF